MKALLVIGLLIGSAHAFAAGSTHELQCDSDSLTLNTFVTTANGVDTLKAVIVDAQGRTESVLAEVPSAQRVDLQSAGIKMMPVGADRAIEQASVTLTIEGSLVSVKGQFNGQLQCLDLRSDNPNGKNWFAK